MALFGCMAQEEANHAWVRQCMHAGGHRMGAWEARCWARTWNAAPSIRLNRAIHSQACAEEGCLRPVAAAQPTRRKPAGTRRMAPSSSGEATCGITSLSAGMLVPQAKNGKISSAVDRRD